MRRLRNRWRLCGAGQGRAEGGGRQGGRAGWANGAAGLAAALRPDSTDSGRATGRDRRPAHPGASERASEAAPRGKSQGRVPSVCAGGPRSQALAAPQTPAAPRLRGPPPGPPPSPSGACAVPLRGFWADPRVLRRLLAGVCGPGGFGLLACWSLRARWLSVSLALCFPRAPKEAGTGAP